MRNADAGVGDEYNSAVAGLCPDIDIVLAVAVLNTAAGDAVSVSGLLCRGAELSDRVHRRLVSASAVAHLVLKNHIAVPFILRLQFCRVIIFHQRVVLFNKSTHVDDLSELIAAGQRYIFHIVICQRSFMDI